MGEPEAVKMMFACGPGMCDMDVSTVPTEESRIFVGGAEGMIKVLDPQDLENPVRELNLDVDDSGDEGLAVTALAVSPAGDELAVGLRNGDVKLYDLPSFTFKSNLTRFTAPVLGLAYGMDGGGVIAACSEEPGIKVIRRNNNSIVLTLEDHDGGTKSVAWDPKGEFLAAAGFDGTVVIWKVDPSLDSLTTEVVSTETYFSKEPPGGGGGPDGFIHLGKVAWHPEGKSLCVTGGTDPLILERGTWKRSMMVPEDAELGGHMKEITVAAFSPDGRSLATSSLDGRVVLWRVEDEQAVKMYVNTEDENWRHLQWLDGSVLAALSTGGSVCTMENATPVVETKNAGIKDTDKGLASGQKRGGNSKEKSSSKGGPSSRDLFDDEAVEENGDASENEKAAGAEEDMANDVAVGDVTADLDGVTGDGDGNRNGDGGALDDVIDMAAMAPAAVPQVEVTPLQDPFQPSSTPLGDARRYLCWNGVGTVISVDENTHNAVEIEFADKAAGRNQRFLDTWNFVMGSLSSTGAIFASVAQDEDEASYGSSPSGGRSVLYYKSLGRRSTGGEWTRMMPKGENILGVAVGRCWAAAATDRQFLRVFTASGLQGETVMLPGPIVTMVGGGDLLAVVFHKGEPMGESQSLGYRLFDVVGKREVSSGSVCTSPGAELTWLGMSEEHMLMAMDSSGLVSALTQSFDWQWTPMLDTLSVSKNKKDRFWPVGVVTGKLLAVALKGGEEHPTAYPRPVLTAVPMSAPVTKSQDGEEMTKFEKAFPAMEARVRQRRFNLEVGLNEDDVDRTEAESELMSQQAQLDTMVVKRIQEACAVDKAERAMDLASLMHLEKSFHIAIKVANHHGLTSLAARMDTMIAKFRGHEDEDEDDEVEPLNGSGGMGGRGFGRGCRAAEDEDDGENLGPLDRARLEAKRASKSREALAPPGRPAARPTASYAGDRYDDDYESADDSGLGNGAAGGMVDLVNLPDSDDEPTGRVLKGLKRRNGSPGEEHDDEEGGRLKDMEQEEEEEEEDVAAPAPAPRNPFARGKTFSSPPRKKKKDVLETMEDLKASPSPLTKRPALTRLSSFATEARTKKRNDRNIL